MQTYLMVAALISLLAAIGGYVLAPAQGRDRLVWMGLALAFPPMVVLLPFLPRLHLLPGHR